MYLEEDYIGTLSSVLLPGVMVQNCSLSVQHRSCLFLYELLLGYLNYHTEKQGCFKINGMSNIDTMYDASYFSIASSTTHAKTWLQQCLDIGQFIRTETVVHNLTRFNKIAIQGTPQMAVDKEAICLSRVYSYYPKCNFPLFYV